MQLRALQDLKHLQRDLKGEQVVEVATGNPDTWAPFAEQIVRDNLTPTTVLNSSTAIISPAWGPSASVEPLESASIDAVAGDWRSVQGWSTIGPFMDSNRLPTWGPMLPPVQRQQHTVIDQRLYLGETKPYELSWQPAGYHNGLIRCHDQDYQAVWIADGKMSSYKKHPTAQAFRLRK